VRERDGLSQMNEKHNLRINMSHGSLTWRRQRGIWSVL